MSVVRTKNLHFVILRKLVYTFPSTYHLSKASMKKTLMVFVLGVVLLGAGCKTPQQAVEDKVAEKVAESLIENAAGNSNVNVDVDGETVTMTGPDGSTFEIGKNRLPENFPSEVPVYAGATVASSSSSGTGTDLGWTVTLTTSDSVSAVDAYYKNAMSTDGWETTYTYTIDQTSAYTASNDTLSATISIAPADDGTGNTMIVMLVGYDESADSEDDE